MKRKQSKLKKQAFGTSKQALEGIFKQQRDHGISNNERRLEQARIKAEAEARRKEEEKRQAEIGKQAFQQAKESLIKEKVQTDLKVICKETEKRIEKYAYWGCMSRDKTVAKLALAETVVNAVKVAQKDPSETNLRKLASAIETFETTASTQGSWTLSFFKESEARQTENEKAYFEGVNKLIEGIEKTLGINLQSGSVNSVPPSPSASGRSVVLESPSRSSRASSNDSPILQSPSRN